LIQDINIPKSIITKYIKPAKNCSDILLNLISDFIDYSKLNLESLTLSFEKINLPKLIENNLHFLKFIAKMKNIKILFETEKENIIITSDARRIK
jgi:signal transduction histidine kinase